MPPASTRWGELCWIGKAPDWSDGMRMVPIGAIRIPSAQSFQVGRISPVSGSAKIVAWFCSALAAARRRSSGLVCHRPTHIRTRPWWPWPISWRALHGWCCDREQCSTRLRPQTRSHNRDRPSNGATCRSAAEVCWWWKRDGLTVDRCFGNLFRKMAFDAVPLMRTRTPGSPSWPRRQPIGRIR
jgi:hypothetical protein